MAKLKRFWKTLQLRMSLLRIWFMKNILLFIRIACVICLVCIFTGVITAETPILGTIIYPIFAPLADEINAVIAEKEIDGLMTFFSVAISVLFSVSMFAIKARSIAQSDIKNPKLKYAMVQANLYFNENGKLVKKIEKATGEDINGDGKIDENDAVTESSKVGFFKGIVSAFQEFNTIMKADFNGNDKDDNDEEEYARVIEEAKLKNAEEATNEIEDIVKTGSEVLVIDKLNEKADSEITEVLTNDEISNEEKTQKIGMFTKLKEWLASRKKAKLEKKDDAEILEDNMDVDSEIDEEEKKVEEKKTVSAEVEEPKTEKEQRADDFLEKLRNRGR